MEVLVIDNYDSFVYNLVHYLDELGCQKIVIRKNDKISLEEVSKYDKILLSPGPDVPSKAGLLNQIIKIFAPEKSIFGICLGQQAIGEVFGNKLINLERVYHGVATDINVVKDDILFRNLPNSFKVGRYHSWVVANPISDELEVTSIDNDGQIMSLRHKQYDVRGVQFHPESILTEYGKQILQNWLYQ